MYLLELQGDKDIYQLMEEFYHISSSGMNREDEEFDAECYQTCIWQRFRFCCKGVQLGLHFSQQLMQQIKAKGVDITYIVLHVGSGTFKPVQVDDVENHKMHAEVINICTSRCLSKNLTNKSKLITIATTSVRSLETAGQNGQIGTYQRGDRYFYILAKSLML